MFRAVLVALETKGGARVDGDPLHLEACMLFQHGVGALGAVYGAVKDVFLGAVILFECIDHFANALALAPPGD